MSGFVRMSTEKSEERKGRGWNGEMGKGGRRRISDGAHDVSACKTKEPKPRDEQ